MKNKLFRKGLSVFMAAAMATSCAATGMTVLAAGGNLVLPQGEQALGKAQPHFPGYRVEDIKNWNAETDPYSCLLYTSKGQWSPITIIRRFPMYR